MPVPMPVWRILALATGSVSALVGPNASHCSAQDQGVTSTIVINAAPPVVWQAIRDPRSGESFHRRIVSSDEHSSVVEETFSGIPLIGATKCLLQEDSEVPGKRMDFCLLRSDKLKQFKGSWTLTPCADGKQTSIRLTTYCDSGVPFARNITNSTMFKNERVRLANLKELAESMQTVASGR